ncbi:hypothetical protein [uncultured Megasphaera sp.]|nr:hypothetical protein [uncultured Megasphaera sp.]
MSGLLLSKGRGDVEGNTVDIILPRMERPEKERFQAKWEYV